MTSFRRRPFVCAICKTTNEHQVVVSTNRMGFANLDLRPPMMERSVLAYAVQTCGACGYCATGIDKAPSIAADVIATEEYRQQLQSAALSPKANAFLCSALVQERTGDYRGAAWSGLRAAWLCDDSANVEGSRSCRQRAAALFQRAREEGQRLGTEPGTDEAVLVDVLRRAGVFVSALKACEDGLRQKPASPISRILEFQRKLIWEEDTSCYTVDKALS